MDETRIVEVVHHVRGRSERAVETRTIVVERALLLDVAGSGSWTLLRTPGNDRELAVGFLHSEGFVRGVDGIAALAECRDNADVLRIALASPPGKTVDAHRVVVSSCGWCGRGETDLAATGLPRPDGRTRFRPSILYEVPPAVLSGQPLFRATGGTHAAGLFDEEGRVLVIREDIGRHNALDKALGWALLTGADLSRLGVFLSGRVSFEIIAKCSRAGVALLAAAGAPTTVAVKTAHGLGITLCGFVRGEEITVYTHPERLLEE